MPPKPPVPVWLPGVFLMVGGQVIAAGKCEGGKWYEQQCAAPGGDDRFWHIAAFAALQHFCPLLG